MPWILEDDYDSEYRYTGRPLAALQGLDDSGCVIYIGTMSKVLMPALRLGYLVVPDELVDAFTAARALQLTDMPHSWTRWHSQNLLLRDISRGIHGGCVRFMPNGKQHCTRGAARIAGMAGCRTGCDGLASNWLAAQPSR